MAQQTTGVRTLKRPLLWVCVVLALAGIPVQATGTGIDVFALLVAGSALFVLERTLGDAVAEFVGALGAALLFTAIAAVGVVYLVTQSGQDTAKRLLVAAETRGYEPLYFRSGRTPDSDDSKEEADRKRKARNPDGQAQRAGEQTSPAESPPPATAALQPPDNAPIPEGSKVVVSTPFWASRAGDRPIALLRVNPQYAVVGEAVSIEVRMVGPTVTAVGGTFTFEVNGRAIGTAPADDHGGAAFRFIPRIPGTYRVGVRLPVATRASAPADASLIVLPSRR